MAIVSLTYRTALEVLMGQHSCVVFSLAQAIHAASLLIGGFVMAAYRLCILWHQQLLGKTLGPFKFFHWILIFEGIKINVYINAALPLITPLLHRSHLNKGCTHPFEM